MSIESDWANSKKITGEVMMENSRSSPYGTSFTDAQYSYLTAPIAELKNRIAELETEK